jgi:hypothetical protein
LGEVCRPEDVTALRNGHVRDLTPTSLPPVSSKVNFETILREIKVMKKDIILIKKALKSHGINVE